MPCAGFLTVSCSVAICCGKSICQTNPHFVVSLTAPPSSCPRPLASHARGVGQTLTGQCLICRSCFQTRAFSLSNLETCPPSRRSAPNLDSMLAQASTARSGSAGDDDVEAGEDTPMCAPRANSRVVRIISKQSNV